MVVAVMEEFDTLTQETLDRYFKVLEYNGYTTDLDLYKVLLICFIQEFVHSNQLYITDNDYRKIDSIIKCMYGKSCLVPFTAFHIATRPLSLPLYLNLSLLYLNRILEDNSIRLAVL